MGTPSDMKTWTPDERTAYRKLNAVSADDAFEDGRESRWGGCGSRDNPFPAGSLQHDRWLTGWLRTDAEIKSPAR